MYSKILVPVDLRHTDKLDRALRAAADIAGLYDAGMHFVSVTTGAPSEVAHNLSEFEQKLRAFADEQQQKYDIKIETRAMTTPDPVRELDDVLDKAVHEIGADLVVMASHVPGFAEHIFASNAGYLAEHSDVSVFVVR